MLKLSSKMTYFCLQIAIYGQLQIISFLVPKCSSSFHLQS